MAESVSTRPAGGEIRGGAGALGLFLLAGLATAACLAAVVALGRSAPAVVEYLSPTRLLLIGATLPVVAFLAAVAIVRWPEAVAGTLIFSCIAFNETIENVFVPLGFFRLYPQDILIAGALATAIVRVRSRSPVRWPATALGKCMGVAFAFAAFQAMRGMALGNEFNAAFGELRRGYFYMIAYVLVLCEGSDPRRLRLLHRFFLLGSMAIVGRGLYRLAMGRLFQMSWFDVYHILGHGDLIFVTFLSYYCLARLVFREPGRRRWPWLALFPVTLGLIILGNFRASWIGFILAGMVGGALLPHQKRRVLVAATLPLAIVVLAAFYAARNVRVGEFGSTLKEEIASKFKSLLDYETDPNIIWRVHSYRAGWRVWRENLLLGAGLGRRLVFHSINASGQQSVQYNHRVHNSLLWAGYTTGMVGLIIFITLHAVYFFGSARRIRALGDRPETGILLAYMAFYVAFMTVALFDVVLEESATAIALYAHMAIVRRLGDFAAERA